MQPSEYVFVSKSFERRASSVNNGEKLEKCVFEEAGGRSWLWLFGHWAVTGAGRGWLGRVAGQGQCFGNDW